MTKGGEKAGARNLVFFRVEWLQPAMTGSSCARWARLGSFRSQIGSPLVFCNVWLFMRAWCYSLVESLVADRSVMAEWLLSCSVARCVDTCGFATWCCKTYCNGCVKVASGFGAAMSGAVARSSFVFCNSISRDRIVMATDLLREVPWRAPRLPTSVCGSSCPAFRASAGRKGCLNLDMLQWWKRMQLLTLDFVCVCLIDK